MVRLCAALAAAKARASAARATACSAAALAAAALAAFAKANSRADAALATSSVAPVFAIAQFRWRDAAPSFEGEATGSSGEVNGTTASAW